MNKKFGLLIIGAMLALMLFNTTAFAEGEVPPEAPAEEPAPADVVVEAPAPEMAPVTETPTEEAAPEPQTVEAMLPESESMHTPSVDVVVVDANGESQTLASAASAEALTSGDPYWFVGTKKYAVVFTGDPCPAGTSIATNTCWESALSPINLALDKIESGLLPTNRKLYIVGGTAYNEDIWIDASSFLDTRKGQLNGFLGVADGSGNYPDLTGYILLEMMKNGFTLTNFTINGFIEMTGMEGAINLQNVSVTNSTGTGIQIGADMGGGTYLRHKGNVTMKDVTSYANAGAGAEVYVNGATTITNGSFNGNGAEGFILNAITGKVAITNFSAIGNQDDNLQIQKYQTGLTIKNAVLNNSVSGAGLYAYNGSAAPVTLMGVIANTNNDYGIYLYTTGAMTLTDVEASGNLNGDGAYLEHTLGLTSVQVTGSNFMFNGLSSNGDGLEIYTKGDVLLTSINAGGNDGDGLYVNNCLEAFGECLGSGVVTLTSPEGAGLDAANSFMFNGSDGVVIFSKGLVTLSNFAADTNGGYGVYVDNHLYTNNITLNATVPYWTNYSNNNDLDGIYLMSKGIIDVSETDASHNTGNYGLFAGTNPSFVHVSDGEFNYNGTGIYVSTYKPITLEGVQTSNNTGYGMYLEVNGARNVGVLGSKAKYNANGIYISTDGSTVFAGVEASGNTNYGARVEGCLGGACSANANFIMSGRNYFNDNGGDGLQVVTDGTISIQNLTAKDNTGSGAYLVNNYLGQANGVTVLNDAQTIFSGNNLGIEIYTNGIISLTRVNASQNVTGAWLDNSSAVSAKALTMTDCDFNENTGLTGGVYADIYGPINIYGLRAAYNTDNGVELHNSNGGVTITSSGRGLTRAEYNGGYGMDIDSTGNVSLNNIYAGFNTMDGVQVSTDGNVVVSGTHSKRQTSFSDNTLRGLDITALGTITINSTVVANNNGGYGIYLNNQGAASAKKISVTRTQTSGNGSTGLFLLGRGAISLSSLESKWNNGDGVYAANNAGTSGLVTVGGASLITDNATDGLEIRTLLNAEVAGVRALGNGNSGIYIVSGTGLTKVTGSVTNFNTWHGIEISSGDRVTISGVKSHYNGTAASDDDGLNVTTTNDNVTINNSSFMGNYGNGIDVINGTGSLIRTSVVAIGNDVDGDQFYQNIYEH